MTHRRAPERNRRSIRLKGYNYALPGAYFVTIVTQGRLCVFGDVVEEKMRLNDSGAMAKTSWEALPRRFPTIEIDEFIIMPNHIHGIITVNEPASVGASYLAPVGAGLVPAQNARHAQSQRNADHAHNAKHAINNAMAKPKELTPAREWVTTARERVTTRVTPTDVLDGDDADTNLRTSLGSIVGAYKSVTTVEYARGVKTHGWQPFPGRLWQRSYYDRIIRDEYELDRAREYIVNNPLKWAIDSENPANHKVSASSP